MNLTSEREPQRAVPMMRAAAVMLLARDRPYMGRGSRQAGL